MNRKYQQAYEAAQAGGMNETNSGGFAEDQASRDVARLKAETAFLKSLPKTLRRNALELLEVR